MTLSVNYELTCFHVVILGGFPELVESRSWYKGCGLFGVMLCSLSGMYQHFGGTSCLHISLKTEAAVLMELLVHIYESIHHHIPQHRILYEMDLSASCIS